MSKKEQKTSEQMTGLFEINRLLNKKKDLNEKLQKYVNDIRIQINGIDIEIKNKSREIGIMRPANTGGRGRPVGSVGNNKTRDSIIEILNSAPEGLTNRQVAEKMGKGIQTVYVALNKYTDHFRRENGRYFLKNQEKQDQEEKTTAETSPAVEKIDSELISA